MNVSITIPKDVSFCIHVTAPDRSSGKDQLSVKPIVDGRDRYFKTLTYQTTAIDTYILISGYDSDGYEKYNNYSGTSTQFKNKNNWMCGNHVTVAINTRNSSGIITNLPDTVQLGIVLWPTDK